MNWTKARAIAREATIFTLLGPVAIVAYFVTIEVYKAPPMVPYKQVKACPYVETDTYEGDGVWFLPQTVPCNYENSKRIEALLDEDMGYVATLEDNQNHYVRLHDGKWVVFSEKDLPEKWGYAPVRRTINQTPLSDYIDLKGAALIAAIFGWPLGFGVWFFYRVIRFAVKG